MKRASPNVPLQLSRTKRIVFSIVPVSIVVAFLALTEIGLRVFGDPRPYRLVNETAYDGRMWLQVNRDYLEKYFPANSPLIPELKPTVVASPKPANGYRVLCLGESSMYGTPYHAGATIPSILQKQLRRICPDRNVEVINLGASAINTNAIRDFAPSTLRLEPDLVLVYTGHNEFYGPDGVGASWLEKTVPWLIRVKYNVRDLRIVRLAQHVLRKLWLSRNSRAPENLMLQVSEGNRVPYRSADTRRIVSQFGSNLRAILAVYASRRIPVIVSDVSSNLMFPPFESDSLHPAPDVSALVREGREARADSILGASYRIDSTNALTAFRLGTLRLSEGDSLGARSLFVRARDEDLLKFRAPSPINAMIGEVCRNTGTLFISSDSALAEASPHGITGPSLFWEHLHLRLEGYDRIADLFLRAMLDHRLVPFQDTARAYRERIPCNPDSLSVSWLDQAIADLSVEGLTARWPFNAFHPSPTVFAGSDTALQHIALEVYGRTLGWNEGSLLTARWFAGHGFPEKARITYEAVLDEYPNAYLVRYALANLLKGQGRLTEAREEYEQVVQADSAYPFARVELGLLLVNLGDFTDARFHLEAALEEARRQLGPRSLEATACYGLSAVAANTGRLDEALQLVNESIRLAPGYRPAIELRGQILRSGPPRR